MLKSNCEECKKGFKHENKEILFCTNYDEFVEPEDWVENEEEDACLEFDSKA